MLIVCPSCASSYSLTREQLGSGRKLKCASCRHQWVARAEDALPEAGEEPVVAVTTEVPGVGDVPEISTQASSSRPADEATEPTPDAAPAKASKEPARRGRSGARGREKVSLKARVAGAIAALRKIPPAAAVPAILSILIIAAIVERKPIVRALPQTARLYAAIGLPVNLRGLAFQDVRSEIVTDRDQSILVVEGTIKAIAAGTTEIPPLQVSVRGAEGQDVYSWTAEAPVLMLKAGESTPFRARLVAPPAEGRDVVIRFAGRDPHANPAESPAAAPAHAPPAHEPAKAATEPPSGGSHGDAAGGHAGSHP